MKRINIFVAALAASLLLVVNHAIAQNDGVMKGGEAPSFLLKTAEGTKAFESLGGHMYDQTVVHVSDGERSMTSWQGRTIGGFNIGLGGYAGSMAGSGTFGARFSLGYEYRSVNVLFEGGANWMKDDNKKSFTALAISARPNIILARGGAYKTTLFYITPRVGAMQGRKAIALEGEWGDYSGADKHWYFTYGGGLGVEFRRFFGLGRIALEGGVEMMNAKRDFAAAVEGKEIYSAKKSKNEIGFFVGVRFSIHTLKKASANIFE